MSVGRAAAKAGVNGVGSEAPTGRNPWAFYIRHGEEEAWHSLLAGLF